MLNVNESYVSVMGEGPLTGLPFLFIRLFGCNLSCPWCDTPTALADRGLARFVEGSVEEMVDIAIGNELPVCITGGEPFQQHKDMLGVINGILEQKPEHFITVETNGTIYIPDVKAFLALSPKLSGTFEGGIPRVQGQNEVLSWIKQISDKGFHDSYGGGYLKWVIESDKLFWPIVEWMRLKISEERRNRLIVYFQPEYGWGRQYYGPFLDELMKPDNQERIESLKLQEFRFSIQAHRAMGLKR